MLDPFEKALRHLLEAQSRPERLPDVITDLHEGLEALAKIMTGRDKTLDENRELFLKDLGAPERFKNILREHIAYAHPFRHGAATTEKKPKVTYADAEAFVYMTGIYIRFAMTAKKPGAQGA